MKIRDAIRHNMNANAGKEVPDEIALTSCPTLAELGPLIAEVEVQGIVHNETRVQTLGDLAELRDHQQRLAAALDAMADNPRTGRWVHPAGWCPARTRRRRGRDAPCTSASCTTTRPTTTTAPDPPPTGPTGTPDRDPGDSPVQRPAQPPGGTPTGAYPNR